MLIPAQIQQSVLEYTASSRDERTNELKDHRAGGEPEQEGGSEGVRDGRREDRDEERREQLGQQIDTPKVAALVCRMSVGYPIAQQHCAGRENLRVEAGENRTVSLCDGGDPVPLDCDRNPDLL